MARILNILGNNDNLGISNNGLKLSKTILLEEIEDHDEFKKIFSIDEKLLERITDSMKAHGFDNSQPIHIWVNTVDGVAHKYLIDGYTRVTGARMAGLISVPYYEHNFESYDEAYRYALSLQVNRRNLEGNDLLKNIVVLMGTDYIKNFEGNKNKEVARLMGKSEKTIERANFVTENASDEQLEAIRNNEATVNKTYNDIKATHYLNENASNETMQQIKDGLVSKKEAVKQLKEQKKNQNRHVSVEEDDFETDDDFDSDIDSFDSDFFEDDDDSLYEDSGVRGVSVRTRKEDDSLKLTPPKETEEDFFIKNNKKLLQEATVNGFKSGLNYVRKMLARWNGNIEDILTENYINSLSQKEIIDVIKSE